MSNAVYPSAVRGLGWTVVKSMSFATLAQPAPNKYEVRIAQTRNPTWKFRLIYNYLFNDPLNLASGLTYTDLQTLMGFFAARQGQFDDFLFTDPEDNSVGPAMLSGAPNTQAELQLVSDGAGTYYSPIQRNLGGQFWEDITDLNGSIAVYANGVLQTDSNYTLAGPGLAIPGSSFMGMYLQWASQPTGPITAEFNFYFRVRFASDEQDFEEFMDQLWTIGGDEAQNGTGTLELVTSRPNPL